MVPALYWLESASPAHPFVSPRAKTEEPLGDRLLEESQTHESQQEAAAVAPALLQEHGCHRTAAWWSSTSSPPPSSVAPEFDRLDEERAHGQEWRGAWERIEMRTKERDKNLTVLVVCLFGCTPGDGPLYFAGPHASA